MERRSWLGQGRMQSQFTYHLEAFSKTPVAVPVHIPLVAPVAVNVGGSSLVIRSLEWEVGADGGPELVAEFGAPLGDLEVRLQSGRASGSRTSENEIRWRFGGAFAEQPEARTTNTLLVVNNGGPLPPEMDDLTLELFERPVRTQVFEGVPLP